MIFYCVSHMITPKIPDKILNFLIKTSSDPAPV